MAEKILGAIKRHKSRLDPWTGLRQATKDAQDFWQLAKEEGDQGQEADLRAMLLDLQKRFEKLRVVELLSETHDEAACFLTIHSGAGGTEACDWASMLYRMYSRWIERHDFKAEVLDLQEAEGGIKSVTVQVDGAYAYGYLKTETGIHRLVRISPFDASGRRHTSFASVYASPILDDTIELDVDPEDLRIDTYRAGGAGGQHVNKTDSAVRITHLKTGIVVQCQNERSQFKNKDFAMKMLKSRLFEYYKEKRDEEREKSATEKKDISWGNQIRSYVFQPYTLVKDTRTKYEMGNIQAVMDGDIDEFIESFLKTIWLQKHQG